MKPSVVVVGTSAGGLRALEKILGSLPAGFSVPIACVQHRSKDSELFASIMQGMVALPVHEAEDKELFTAPGVYLAPPDYHLLVEPGGMLALSTGAAANSSGRTSMPTEMKNRLESASRIGAISVTIWCT